MVFDGAAQAIDDPVRRHQLARGIEDPCQARGRYTVRLHQVNAMGEAALPMQHCGPLCAAARPGKVAKGEHVARRKVEGQRYHKELVRRRQPCSNFLRLRQIDREYTHQRFQHGFVVCAGEEERRAQPRLPQPLAKDGSIFTDVGPQAVQRPHDGHDRDILLRRALFCLCLAVELPQLAQQWPHLL